MSVHFAVLSSGSRGNSTLIRGASAGLLLDVGLGPRILAERLESVGSSWDSIGAALLTHTHGDHVNNDTLRQMGQRRIVLYCHEGHRKALKRHDGFRMLNALNLVRHYNEDPFLTQHGARIEPIRVQHGVGPTFGFRIEMRPQRGARSVTIGFITDSGCWTEPMAETLVGVDVLAVEFNHDVRLQWGSSRPIATIVRNLGDQGHLSNEQGAELVRAVFDRSGARVPRHIVLLHMSEQCNQPNLAIGALQTALRGTRKRTSVHAAQQTVAYPNLRINPGRRIASPPTPPATAQGFPWEAPIADGAEAEFALNS